MPPQSIASRSWVDETPGHGADVVEELQGGGCVSARRGVREAKDPQVNIDLLCGSVGDSEVVEPVSSGTAVAWRPGASAFGSAAARAAGGPASPHRRGRAGVTGRTATAPMARRRPTSRREQLHRSVSPRGLPGIGIVRGVKSSRKGIVGTMPCPARPGKCQKSSCSDSLRVDQPPGHCADLVEEVEDSGGPTSVDRARPCEEADVGVDLLGRGEGDAPVANAVAAGSSVSLRQVCRHRCCRSDHLIGERLQRSGHPPDERDGLISRIDYTFPRTTRR